MQNISKNIDINTLKFLYEHYKDFIVPFFVILASFLIFARVVLPSIFDLFDAREKQKIELEILRNIEKKVSHLKTIDESTLDSQLRIVSKALPIDKDFEGIMNAVSDASGRSRVSIASFKFIVGSLSEEEDIASFPTLEMDLAVNGSSYEANDFIERLQKTLPFSEVSKISAGTDLSNIKISFFYKRLVLSQADDSLPFGPVSAKGLSLINDLSTTFNIPQSFALDLTATSSAINPNPFE